MGIIVDDNYEEMNGIPVLDDVTIAEQRFTSFAERGLLA